MNSTVSAIALLTLRIGPLFAIAPPFSQINVPVRIRITLVLGLAAALAPVMPSNLPQTDGAFIASAACELILGLAIAFSLQIAFASLSFAGRALDVQAGFGLALVIDPGSRGRAPLLGTALTMGAGMIFFANNGHLEAVRLLASMANVLPVGQSSIAGSPEMLIGYTSLIMGIGLSAVAAAVVTLFLIDITIGFLSRALPQMNALMMGLQVKAIAALVMLALSAGLLGPVVLRLLRHAFDYTASLATQ
ncbi:MAG: flagellar biosynthetic protein FliR [Pseudomonas sp.]|uniref:flagellar biosynthetic protein FliR n=1 Tax=Stenotrophomonas sp. TaxID=69392 RepID=UPI003D6D519D